MAYFSDICPFCGQEDLHLTDDCPGLEQEGIPISPDGHDEDVVGLVIPIRRCPVTTVAPPYNRATACQEPGGWDIVRVSPSEDSFVWEAREVVSGAFCEAHAKQIAAHLSQVLVGRCLERLLDDIKAAA